MSVFVYSDTEERKAFGMRGTVDPHKPYLKHAANWFFLRLIYSNGSVLDKFQATKELAICDRKLEYWSRKPNFDPTAVEEELRKLKKEWNLEFHPNRYDELQQKWLKQVEAQSKPKPKPKFKR